MRQQVRQSGEKRDRALFTPSKFLYSCTAWPRGTCAFSGASLRPHVADCQRSSEIGHVYYRKPKVNISRRKLQFETASLTVDLQCRCRRFYFDRFEESTWLAAVSRRHDLAASRWSGLRVGCTRCSGGCRAKWRVWRASRQVPPCSGWLSPSLTIRWLQFWWRGKY